MRRYHVSGVRIPVTCHVVADHVRTVALALACWGMAVTGAALTSPAHAVDGTAGVAHAGLWQPDAAARSLRAAAIRRTHAPGATTAVFSAALRTADLPPPDLPPPNLKPERAPEPQPVAAHVVPPVEKVAAAQESAAAPDTAPDNEPQPAAEIAYVPPVPVDKPYPVPAAASLSAQPPTQLARAQPPAEAAQHIAQNTPLTNAPTQLVRGGLMRPVSGQVVRRYGQKHEGGERQLGLTFATAPAAPVQSPFAGVVTFAGSFLEYGNMVIIRHSDGYHSLLAGLGEIDCRQGQHVDAGAIVGRMPAGASPSLYVELRERNQPIDPQPWLRDV